VGQKRDRFLTPKNKQCWEEITLGLVLVNLTRVIPRPIQIMLDYWAKGFLYFWAGVTSLRKTSGGLKEF